MVGAVLGSGAVIAKVYHQTNMEPLNKQWRIQRCADLSCCSDALRIITPKNRRHFEDPKTHLRNTGSNPSIGGSNDPQSGWLYRFHLFVSPLICLHIQEATPAGGLVPILKLNSSPLRTGKGPILNRKVQLLLHGSVTVRPQKPTSW